MRRKKIKPVTGSITLTSSVSFTRRICSRRSCRSLNVDCAVMEYTRAKPWPFFMYRSLIAVNCSCNARKKKTRPSVTCFHSFNMSCVLILHVRLDLLFQLCPRFQAYIVARRPRLAVRGKTNFFFNGLNKQIAVLLYLKVQEVFFFYLSVGVFYCGVILLHKNALHKLDCLEWGKMKSEYIIKTGISNHQKTAIISYQEQHD